MLRSLLPKAHHKFSSLPLLGPIIDGFDDWLAASGYTPGSREFAIRMLPHVDADLRRRRARRVASLTPAMLHDCWRALIKTFPTNAGTVRSLARYLATAGIIGSGGTGTAERSASVVLSEEYATHLRDVRGFAPSTVGHHRYASQCFLNHLKTKKVPLGSIQPEHVEAYIKQAGKRLCRASLQHDIAALRGFLRFLATHGRAPTGLDRRIDTPRLYRLEQLPRALPWDTVMLLLSPSIPRQPWGFVTTRCSS
jgi:integrase/recombinase XerD